MSHAAATSFDESYYAEFYPDYERQNPSGKMRYYRELVMRHWTPELPRRVHDVGCAFGKFLSCLGQDWEAYGTDLSEFALKAAEKRVPWGKFRVQGGTAPSPAPGPLGVVTAFDVAEHVPDVEAFRERVAEQLVPRGLFVFVVPVYDGLSGPVIRRLDKDPTHVHKWPRERWLRWAEPRFEVLQWEGVVRYLLPVGPYLHLPTRAMRRHTPAISVVCRRL